ncbi:GIY-YIG nuclease family protein [Shivajiella indica]|uniref:GIY-YIG nuclease family protein n=1 Tax=Shivajiella indica TaxID=872115 RepID=A0ABW5BDQ1_9BACT
MHNSSRNPSTKNGIPWVLVYFCKCESRPEAMKLEKQIKNLGTSRFFEKLKSG